MRRIEPSSMHLTLCSYTYNDGNLLDGLLAHLNHGLMTPEALRKWSSVQLAIMDDGSKPPYVLPLPWSGDARVQLLRHEENLGFHKAKSDCLDVATGDFIFALDCDARPSADWLERALPNFDDPAVALVGGAVSYHAPSMGHGPAARYLAAFDGDMREKPRGPVDMVPGQAWLIRASAWREVDGFGSDALGCLEDHALGHRLRQLGYVLLHEPEAHSFLVRRLSRRAMVKRFWAWLRHHVPGLAARGEDPLNAFLGPMTDRLNSALAAGEPIFAYLEFLYLAHAMTDARPHAPDLLAPVVPCLTEALRKYPRTRRLFHADLLRMGVPLPGDTRDHPSEKNNPGPRGTQAIAGRP